MTIFALSALLFLALAWGAYWYWRRGVDRDVAQGGASEHARLSDLDERAAAARAEAAALTGRPEEGAVAALSGLRKDVLRTLSAAKLTPRLSRAPDREALLGFIASESAAWDAPPEPVAVRAEALSGYRREEAVALAREVRDAMLGANVARETFEERAPGTDWRAGLAFAMGRRLTLASHTPLLRGMPQPEFQRIYARVETPRFPAYALAATTVFVLGTPLMFGLLGALGAFFEPADVGQTAMRLQMGDGGTASMARQVSTEELQYILQGWSGFYYFFGMLAFWIVILAVTMRRYHARTPDLLREEVLRSR